jgi:hypothetical protein
MNQRQILILQNGKGHFCHFLTIPIVKKSKADTKVKKNLMTEMTLAKLKMNGSNNLNGFSWTMARLVTVLLQNHVNLMRNF